MQYVPKQIYIGGFNPVTESVLGGAAFIASAMLGFMFAMVATKDHNIPLWVGIFTGIVTLMRAWSWHGKWLDRELRIKCIDIQSINRLSDSQAPIYKKQQAIELIKNRQSKVWFSYTLFFAPHTFIVLFCWKMLSLY